MTDNQPWRQRVVTAVRPLLPWLAVALFALAVGGFGSRLLNPLPETAYTPLALGSIYLGEILLAAAAIWLYRTTSLRPQSQTPALPDPQTPPGNLAPAPEPTAPSTPAEDTSTHPRVERVRAVLRQFYSSVYIAAGSVEIVDDDRLRSFTLKNRAAGGFSEDAEVEKLFGRVTKAIDGVWNLKTNTIEDSLTLTLKDGFPRAVSLPIPDQIATTTKQALTMHSRHRLSIGIDESGAVLSLSMKAFPHIFCVGGTGSGKSVFMRSIIEDFRAAGFMIIIGDGKTTDYTGLIGLPNISLVSQSGPMHVRTVRMYADEIRARQADARHNQRNDPNQPPFNRPPMILIIDEFASMIDDIGDQYGSDEFYEDLTFIGRMGRQFKCHMIIASQEAYRGIVPGPLMAAMKAKISLGPPEDRTIMEVFPPNIRREAKRIGGGIDKERDPGRGLVLLQDDKTGSKIVEFQSFYGYSPADPDPSPAILQADHEVYRDEVSTQIPKLYPRLGFAVDGPDFGRDLEHLYSLPLVLLDDPDGNPDPANDQYDPLSDHFNGIDESSTAPPIPSLTEMRVSDPQLPSPWAVAAPAEPAPPHSPAGDTPPWEDHSYAHGSDPFDSPGPPPDFAVNPAPADTKATSQNEASAEPERATKTTRNTGVVSI